MTACNARPPEDHPFHGSLVACHLAAGHDEPHSWEIHADTDLSRLAHDLSTELSTVRGALQVARSAIEHLRSGEAAGLPGADDPIVLAALKLIDALRDEP